MHVHVANVPAGAPGSTHVDVVTVVVTDDDAVTATDTDDATVTRTGVAPTVTVDKSANPTTVSEFGGPVTYTVVVTNTSAESVTLTSLVDDQFGNLDQDDVGNHSWTSSTCDTGGTLAAANAGDTDTYTCTFIANVPAGAPGSTHVDVVTVVVTDDDAVTATDTDDATVTRTGCGADGDGGQVGQSDHGERVRWAVTYTVVVTNTSAESVTLTSLVDDQFGNLDQDDVGNHSWTSSTCDTGGTLAAANAGDTDTYTCTFVANVPAGAPGSTHVDVVTVVVTDDDAVTATDTDDATVTRTGVAPTVTVDKSANPTTVSEFGGAVTYTVVVTNTSAESVTLTSLVDDQFGNLDQDDVGNHSWTSSTCDTGSVLAASNAGDTDTYTCTFTANVPAGAPGSSHVNEVTATAVDDDGTTVTAT